MVTFVQVLRTHSWVKVHGSFSFEVSGNAQYSKGKDAISVTVNNHEKLSRHVEFCLESTVE